MILGRPARPPFFDDGAEQQHANQKRHDQLFFFGQLEHGDGI